jgi:hypothetical protein
MIALVLAAGLAASDPADLLGGPHACNRGMLHASADPALLMRPQDWRAARPRKLGELPRAKVEYAVMRRVDGCMVPAPVGFHPKPIQ